MNSNTAETNTIRVDKTTVDLGFIQSSPPQFFSAIAQVQQDLSPNGASIHRKCSQEQYRKL
jgi:hypothetical protein